jgi:hypothetical protein
MLGVWRLQLLREVSRRGSVKAAAEAIEGQSGHCRRPSLQDHGRRRVSA